MPRLEAADHAQPRRHRLAQQRAAAGEHRLLLQRNQQVRREFMFVAPALPITGAVGSPVNPLAIK